MKKVKDTKNPTVRQLRNIAKNLKEHLNTSATAEIASRCYDHSDDIDVEYGIYIASDDQSTHMFRTWQGLLIYYHELMERKV